MRFPLTLTTAMVGYIAKNKIRRKRRFPLVLMLEPLHACNLTCTGCGRIREYETTIKQKLSVEECVASSEECGAPIVSICGGEPMIYPEIGRLVSELLRRRRHIILCTNGMFIQKRLHEFKPTSRFFFNVHLDGLEDTHDRAVEREGVFRAAIEGIGHAGIAGQQIGQQGIGPVADGVADTETGAQLVDQGLRHLGHFHFQHHLLRRGHGHHIDDLRRDDQFAGG